MADKKTTGYTEKITIVDNDLIEIIDSEELVLSEQNKKVKRNNYLASVAAIPVKIWDVNFNDGLDTNPGTFNKPVKTVQKAYDLRILDGFTGTGVIRIQTPGTDAGLTATITILPTLVIANVTNVILTAVVATDVAKLQFKDIQSVSALQINQTVTNFCLIEYFNTRTGAAVTGSVVTAGQGFLSLKETSEANLNASSPDLTLSAFKKSILKFNGVKTFTIAIQTSESTVEVNANVTLNDLTMERGIFDADGTSAVTVVDFDHSGIQFVRKSSVTISGTETKRSGEWADVDPPKFFAGVIKTLVDDLVEAGTDKHLIIAAQSGTTDNLIEIDDLNVGDEILVRADTGDTITVKHNDAGATIKILITADADLILDEDNPLRLTLVATNKLCQNI